MKTKTTKKRFIILALLIIILFAHFSPDTVLAAPTTPAGGSTGTADLGTSDVINKVLVEVQAKLSPFVSTMQSLLWPILLMIGSLLQNDLLFGAGMEDRLLLIWTNIRNIVNILFVFVLLAIAFYNIFGAGENYTLKKELPKFIIALIAVNFTYIGVKVILDGVNIISTALFALPNSVQQGLAQDEKGKPKGLLSLTEQQADGICGGIIGFPVGSNEYETKYKTLSEASSKAAATPPAKGKTTTPPAKGKTPPATPPAKEKKAPATPEKPGQYSICRIAKDKDGNILSESGVRFFSQFGAQNAAVILAVAMGKTNLLSNIMVPPSQLTVSNLIKNSLFSIILYVIYITAFIALFVVLLVRLVVLWMMIVLSPFMVLKYVLPQNIAGSLGDTGALQKKFITHVIIPIKISLVLSIGFIMLDALQKANFSKIQGVNFLSIKTLDIDLLTSGISTLQEFIVAIGMVAFIWVAVFQALKETAAEGAVNAIKGAVGGVGKFIGKLPLMAPIFPIGGGQSASIGELGYALQQAEHIPREAASRGASKKGLLIGSGAETMRQMHDASTRDEFVNAATQARSMSNENDYRKASARYYEKHLSELERDFTKTLNKGKYTSANQFLNDLKNNPGNIPHDVMNSFLDAAGIKHGVLPETASPAETQSGLTADQDAKWKKRGDTEVAKEIKPDEKKKLDALADALKTQDKDAIDKAKTDAVPILNKLIAIESAETVMQVEVKDIKITDPNMQEQFNTRMNDRIETLKKAGVDDADAKKKVLEAVSEGMSDDQRDKFKDLPDDKFKLLKEAAANVKPPPAASKSSKKP